MSSDPTERGWSQALEPLPEALDWLDEHKLVATLLLFGFASLKVVVVSKGDIPTALAILQTAGPVSIIVGSLLSGLPLLALAILVAVVYRSVREESRRGYLLALAPLVACVFLAP